jgi:DNA-directed RNA polymerase subunit RPC12/RpoP
MANEEKNRRMELRREIGNRKVKGISSPSPRTAYLMAHACFNCRKSFKLSCEKSHVCPECGELIRLMGRAFNAPKRNDDEQWRKVQKLYALGFRFHRYGGDYPSLPERLREVDRFVEEFPEHELRVAEPDLSLLPGKR